MQIAIISTALAIVLFLCAFIGFREGVRIGMNTAKGITPPPVKTPVQAIQEVITDVTTGRAAKEQQDALNAMLTFDGNLPKE